MFEKISLDTWLKYENKSEDTKTTEDNYKNISIPKRKTLYSAGYDFSCPMKIELVPGETKVIPTGIKVDLSENGTNEGYYLSLYPRSSYGFKYGLRLDNTVGIIDADYYNNPSNEGHILVAVQVDKPVTIEAGTSFCQGIIHEYFVFGDEVLPEESRVGGIGSTDK